MAGDFKAVSKRSKCPICGADHRCALVGDWGVWCVRAGGREAPGWKVVVRTKVKGAPVPAFVVDSSGGTLYALEGSGAGLPVMTPEERAERRAEAEKRDREEKARKVAQARRVWESSKKAVNHAAARAYLAGRGIPLSRLPEGKVPPAVRFVAAAQFWHEDDEGAHTRLQDGPALFCEAVDGAGEFVGFQRVYLDLGGSPSKRRAEVSAPAHPACRRV